MTQAVGAHSAYDEAIGTAGNREDLSDVIWDVTPTDTPFVTLIGKAKKKATGIHHEWLIDALEDAVATNAHIEGDDATPTDAAARTRLSNYTQILKKHAVVTGTQETVLKGGGVKSEMAYQMARRMKAIKLDLEMSCIGAYNVKVAGNDTTAREMGGFMNYLVTGFNGGAAATAPTGNAVDSPGDGTDRDLDEAIFDAALQGLFNNSGGNKNVTAIVSAHNKGVISDFTASSTRNVTTDDKKLVASIDVYDGDFHTVKIVPSRHILASSALIVDPEYAGIADLRPIHSYDLAKIGDSFRKEIVWECTLEVNNEAAHVHIADLNES